MTARPTTTPRLAPALRAGARGLAALALASALALTGPAAGAAPLGAVDCGRGDMADSAASRCYHERALRCEPATAVLEMVVDGELVAAIRYETLGPRDGRCATRMTDLQTGYTMVCVADPVEGVGSPEEMAEACHPEAG